MMQGDEGDKGMHERLTGITIGYCSSLPVLAVFTQPAAVKCLFPRHSSSLRRSRVFVFRGVHTFQLFTIVCFKGGIEVHRCLARSS